MRDLRIALLNATHRDQNAIRNFRRELDESLAEFDVTGGQVPSTYAYDAVVVTGSRASVYWDEPWIPETKAWVAEAIDRGLPCLGICWGHQLLADVLGGEVQDMGVYEIGYREIKRTTEDSLLFDGIDASFTAFTTHSDEVASLPPGAEELASNDYSNHGFRLDRVFGVQFHPEYDAKSARELTLEKPLSEDRRERVLAGITDETVERAYEAKQVFDNFLAFAADVRAVPVDSTATSVAEIDAGDHADADAAGAGEGAVSPATVSSATTPDGVTRSTVEDLSTDESGTYSTTAVDGCSSDD